MASIVETAIRGIVSKGAMAVADFNRQRLPDEAAYLQGVHEPMKQELTLEDLAVDGAIPAELNGRYLRIGPNPVTGDGKGYHWFTGDGMVHGVALRDGKALWYRNRWIRSNRVAETLGLPAAPGPHRPFDTVNTNVLGIGDRTFALVEAGSYPVELGETLEDQVYSRFDDTLAGSFTAHPHLDPRTGENHGVCYEATQPDVVRHVVVSAEGKVTREVAIPVEHGPSIHDCAITGRFAIILDLPVTFSMKALIGGHRFPYRWNPEHKARIGLLPRTGAAADIIWIDCPRRYIFHVANAFDAPDGKVVMDACVYETMFAEETGGPNGRSLGLERWTIDCAARTVAVETLDGAPQEFPRPDERFFGQPYRYAFTMALPDRDFAISETRLYKHDLTNRTRETHDFGPGRHPGEFVFVPRSGAAAEGDGWLVGLVVDMNDQTTDLAIIDATDFTAPPVARVRLPHRVPPGFHGNWVAGLGG